jgi:hypothetical protein
MVLMVGDTRILREVSSSLRQHGHDPDISVLDVRLAVASGRSTIQVIYRFPEIGPCLYGWSFDWASAEPIDPGWITEAFDEQNLAGGWGPPERCDPDNEGITWWVHPYGGREYGDWTFADHVESAVRGYFPSARPVSRQEVEAVINSGVSSVAELEVVAQEGGPLAHTASWLLSELAEEARINRAVRPESPTWFDQSRQQQPDTE